MTVTSFSFLAFLVVGGLCYYMFPKSWQWVELLILSLIFYCLAATPYTLLFILLSTGTAWTATNYPFGKSECCTENKHIALLLVGTAIFLNSTLWFMLKGNALWLSVACRLEKLWPILGELKPLPVAAALGMGYYTLQVVGYILDCYWGTAKPQKNIVKLLLFLLFFPQLITGPISRYNELQSLYQKHDFDYIRITRGAQRILWGFVKKLVLAERLAVFVDTIWGGTASYPGLYHWIAFLLYPLQMYADFSGCMDIVIGAAEVFGIHLNENFRTPFFSRTVQEFWQRWHITLGTWTKDYVMYPFLKSKYIIALGKWTRKRFGKRIGKLIPTAMGMFLLWTFVGIWHGALQYIAGVTLWFWMILMLGEVCTPFLNKVSNMLHLKRECFSWRLFQCIRTYIFFAIGGIFFRAPGFGAGVSFLQEMLKISLDEVPNFWIFFDGSISTIVGGGFELNILIIALLLLAVAEWLHEKYGTARKWIAEQGIVFRWMVWLGLFFFVLIFGMYGPGYDAAEFIYGGF